MTSQKRITTDIAGLVEAYLDRPSGPRKNALAIALLQELGDSGRLHDSTAHVAIERVIGMRGEKLTDELREGGSSAIVAAMVEQIQRSLGTYRIVLPVPVLKVESKLPVGKIVLVPSAELEDTAAFARDKDERNIWHIKAMADCFAELELPGDDWAAFRDAIEIVRETWTVFYFAALKYGVAQITVGGPVNAWYARDDGVQGAFGGAFKTVELFSPLDAADVEKMRSSGFTSIEAVLLKPIEARTDLEDRLLKATAWWVLGHFESHPGIALVSFVTAMETVLLTQRPSEARRTLAQRVACFVDTEPGKRAEAFRDCDAVASARNKVVHSGEREAGGALGKAEGLARVVISKGWDAATVDGVETGEDLARLLDAEVFAR